MVMVAQPWWPLSPWLSPGAAWFIFFNAVVAAIAVMSSCAQQEGHVSPSSRRRLCRSTSSAILDQLQSFSLFSVHTTAGGVTGPLLDGHGDLSDSDYYCSSQEAEVASSPQVTQASMVLPVAPRSTAPAAGESVVMPAVPSPQCEASVPAAADLASAPESTDDEADAEEEQGRSISLDEAYAMIQQNRQRQPPSSPAATAASLAKKKDLAAKAPKRRARSSGREAEAAAEGKAELNARAELFIRQFREELMLQRLNSLLGHTHALVTGDGAPTAGSRRASLAGSGAASIFFPLFVEAVEY
ncbi:hypothetical protein EJB05_49400, partial [Eragrostis curvula]